MRTYRAVRDQVDAFNEFFRTWLLPVQLRHGARLVGRWHTEDHRIVAVWEYDGLDHYRAVEAAVRADPDATEAQRVRRTLPELFSDVEEVFMTSTVAS